MEEQKQKTYEISFLSRGEEGAGAVVGYLNKVGAEIVGEGQVEQMALAYPINKNTTAHFGYIHFNLNPEMIDSLRELLKFEAGVLRYIIVTPPFVQEEVTQPRRIRPDQLDQNLRAAPSEGMVSNEDLEAKLEEINEPIKEE